MNILKISYLNNIKQSQGLVTPFTNQEWRDGL